MTDLTHMIVTLDEGIILIQDWVIEVFSPRDVYFRSCSYLSFHFRRKEASQWIISLSSSHDLEFVQQVTSSLVEASEWPYSWVSPPPVTTQGNLKNLIESCKNQKKATSDELSNAPF